MSIDAKWKEQSDFNLEKMDPKDHKYIMSLDTKELKFLVTKCRERVFELKQKVEQLEKQQEQKDELHLEISRKLQEDNEKYTQQCDQLEKYIIQLKQQFEQEKEELLDMKNEEIKELKQKFSQREDELKDQIQEKLDVIKKTDEYREQEEGKRQELKKVKDDLQHLVRKHNDEYKKLEDKFNQYKNQYNEDTILKLNLDQLKQEAEQNALDKLKNNAADVELKNRLLQEELEIYKRDLNFIKSEKNQLLEENKNYKVNLSINGDGVQEYQQLHLKQNSKLKQMKEKIEYLKNFISEEVIKYTKEIELLKFQNQQRVSELEYELNVLRDQLKIKMKEIRNLRSLAQMILDQRTDIEIFFLSALEQVKEEIKKNSILEKKQGLFPDISKNKTIDYRSKMYDEKVDLSELEWEDKERILRILFSKINTGVQPQFWRGSNDVSKINTSAHREEEQAQSDYKTQQNTIQTTNKNIFGSLDSQ